MDHEGQDDSDETIVVIGKSDSDDDGGLSAEGKMEARGVADTCHVIADLCYGLACASLGAAVLDPLFILVAIAFFIDWALWNEAARIWDRLADDPPRQDWNHVTRIPSWLLSARARLPSASSALTQALLEFVALSQAKLEAHEKAQGASRAGSRSWVAIHKATLVGLNRELPAALHAVAQALRAVSADLPKTLTSVQSPDRRVLARVRGALTAAGIDATRARQMTAKPPAPKLPANPADALAKAAARLDALAWRLVGART